jgi:hypothetical protein
VKFISSQKTDMSQSTQSIYFTGNPIGFYPFSEKPLYDKSGSWPKNAVEMTPEEKATYYMQPPPDGKQLGSANGRPAWFDIPVTLDEVQASKKAELEQAFQSEQGADIEFTTQGGVTKEFQADAVSQELLLKAVVGFDLIGGTPPGFCWVAKDNTQVPVTLADLEGLYSAMLARGGVAFQRLQDRKQAVRDAESVDAVQSITWESAE